MGDFKACIFLGIVVTNVFWITLYFMEDSFVREIIGLGTDENAIALLTTKVN